MDPIVLNTVISLAAIVVAPLISLLSVLLQSLLSRKTNENAFIAEHKIKAIEDYLESVGRFVFRQYTVEDTVAKGMTVFMYAPKPLHKDIQEMNELLVKLKNTHRNDGTDFLYTEACEKYMSLCCAFSTITNRKHWHRSI